MLARHFRSLTGVTTRLMRARPNRRVVNLLVSLLCCVVVVGCSRKWFRRQADADVYKAIQEKGGYLDQGSIYPSQASRLYDPYSAYRPPLLVGGIGIMNIMLATVTERTREIGIRRALGARRRDITRQFLIETVLLSVAGGITGIIAGLTCNKALEVFRWLLMTSFPEVMKSLPETVQTMEPIIIPWSIPIAFGISVGVGVIFGLYPARRAAAMSPIDALRHAG